MNQSQMKELQLKLKNIWADESEINEQFDNENNPSESVDGEVEEAVNQAADPIYELLNDLGDDEGGGAYKTVLDELIRQMSGDDIVEFVDDFRRTHDMDVDVGDEEQDDSNVFQQSNY